MKLNIDNIIFKNQLKSQDTIKLHKIEDNNFMLSIYDKQFDEVSSAYLTLQELKKVAQTINLYLLYLE